MKETIAHYYDGELCWYLTSAYDEVLPAPTADELGEEMSWSDFRSYWWDLRASTFDDPLEFAHWLYTTLLDPDKLADVWVKMKGSR